MTTTTAADAATSLEALALQIRRAEMERVDLIHAAHAAGLSNRQIAAAAGVSHPFVAKVLRRRAVTR